MELLFNELSIFPLSSDNTSIDRKVRCFIDAIKSAKQKGFRKIRLDYRIDQIQLAENLTLHDWMLQSKNKTAADLLRGIFTHPFLDLENEQSFKEYDTATYTFQNDEYSILPTPCLGLAAAAIYELPAISFSSFPLWESSILTILIEKNGTITQENIVNLATKDHIEGEEFQLFFERYYELILPETNIQPNDKKYHLSDHHGQSELTALCKQLINSQYVIEMKSTKWGGKSFIRRIQKDGVVEIVLIKTQRKYALWVQTTGTTYRQTKAIAEILEERYS